MGSVVLPGRGYGTVRRAGAKILKESAERGTRQVAERAVTEVGLLQDP